MRDLHKRVANLYMKRKTASSLSILSKIFPGLAPDSKSADQLLETLVAVLGDIMESSMVMSHEIVNGPVESSSISPVYVDDSRTPYGYDSDEERDLPNGALVRLSLTVPMRDLIIAVSRGLKSVNRVESTQVFNAFLDISKDVSALRALGKVLSEAYATQYLYDSAVRNINLINDELSNFVLTHGKTYNEVLDFSNAEINSYEWNITDISVHSRSVTFAVKAFGEFEGVTFSVEDEGY